jgi:hypothetical protein
MDTNKLLYAYQEYYYDISQKHMPHCSWWNQSLARLLQTKQGYFLKVPAIVSSESNELKVYNNLQSP